MTSRRHRAERAVDRARTPPPRPAAHAGRRPMPKRSMALAEDPPLHLGRQRRVAELLLERLADLERPEGGDLVLRRAVPDRVGAPQDALGPERPSSLPRTWAASSGLPMTVRHVEPSSAYTLPPGRSLLRSRCARGGRRPSRRATDPRSVLPRSRSGRRGTRDPGGLRRPGRCRSARRSGLPPDSPCARRSPGRPCPGRPEERRADLRQRRVVVVEVTSRLVRACRPSRRDSSWAPRPRPSKARAASRGPTSGTAWPWISTRPSPHSSAASALPAPWRRSTAGRRRRPPGSPEMTATAVSLPSSTRSPPVLRREAVDRARPRRSCPVGSRYPTRRIRGSGSARRRRLRPAAVVPWARWCRRRRRPPAR